MQSKPADGATSSQPDTAVKPEMESSNSVTSVVTPILEKTDNYLASWGLTTSSRQKSDASVVRQDSCSFMPN